MNRAHRPSASLRAGCCLAVVCATGRRILTSEAGSQESEVKKPILSRKEREPGMGRP